MEYLTGILVTFPLGTQLSGNHRKLAERHMECLKVNPDKLGDLYYSYSKYCSGGVEQFRFLLAQFCTKTVLEELDAIMALEHPSKEYRHIKLDNGVVVIYAVGHIAYVLTLAIAFGFGPILKIKDSYVC